VETYCGLALSGQRSGRYPGMCVQAVGQRLRASDESALEVAPPDRRLDLRRSRRCAIQIDGLYLYTVSLIYHLIISLTFIYLNHKQLLNHACWFSFYLTQLHQFLFLTLVFIFLLSPLTARFFILTLLFLSLPIIYFAFL